MPRARTTLLGLVVSCFSFAISGLGCTADHKGSGTVEAVDEPTSDLLPDESPFAEPIVFPKSTATCLTDTKHAKGAWTKLRTTYPFHHQSIALSEPFGEGCRTIIVAEPPPHVGIDNIENVLSSPKLAWHTERHGIGFDGWVTDLVANLPPLSEVELNEVLSDFHRSLFGTSYKAYATPITSKPHNARSKLPINIHVQPGELQTWMLESGMKLTRWDGGPAMDTAQLLAGQETGVYFATDDALVVWALPRDAKLNTLYDEIRQFAIDSDLILGAVVGDKNVLIVARERQVPLDILPPLRSETVDLLSTVGKDELAQSFERTHLTAGILDDGTDWAPIYLSDVLLDTELGSLLNITDQLLKSWSNHGTTVYKNFVYPTPRAYPFRDTVVTELRSSSVTYNWNTTGFGFVAEVDGKTLIATGPTGALPMTYLVEGDKGNAITKRAETTAYRYFAEQSDPLLVRVAQYASLYQIFRQSLHHSPYPQPKTKSSKDLTNAMADSIGQAFEKIIKMSSSDIRRASADLTARFEKHCQTPPGTLLSLRLDIHNQLTTAYIRLLTLSPSSRKKVAHILASLRDNDSLVTDDEAAAVKELLGCRFAVMAVSDAEKVRNALVMAAALRPISTIRTPSVVVSQNKGTLLGATGGHSLRSKLFKIDLSHAAPKGTIAKIDGGAQLAHADLPRLATGYDREVRLVKAPRPPKVALQSTTPIIEKDRGFRAPSGEGFGWQPKARTSAAASSCKGDCINVRRTSDGYEVTLPDKETVLMTRSMKDVVEIVDRHAQIGAKRGKLVELTTEGLRLDEAQGLSGSVQVRNRANMLMMTEKVRGSGAKRMLPRAVGDDFHVAQAKISSARVKKYSDGSMGVGFEIRMPAKAESKPSLCVRVRLFFRRVVSSDVARQVQSVIDKVLRKLNLKNATVQNLAAELKSELQSMDLFQIDTDRLELELHLDDLGDIIVTDLDLKGRDIDVHTQRRAG